MRLIDADESINRIVKIRPTNPKQSDYSHGVDVGLAMAMVAIEEQPTIEPVRKGHWDNVDETPYIRKHFNVVCCSVCRKKGYTAWNYCPNCGAKMEGPEDIPMEYFESGGR